MASSENTAVNELIARASGGGQTSIESTYPGESRAAFDEPPVPVTPTQIPIAALPAVAYRDPAVAQSWRSAPGAWSEPTQLVRPRHRERFVGTLRTRPSDLRIVIGKLVLPMVLLVIAGIVTGGYVVFSGGGGRLSSRAVAAVPAPEAAPAMDPVPAAADSTLPEPAPASPGAAAAESAAMTAMLVDVRIDSTPSGATVTLVDRGKAQLVGNTPVNATVDASREYDLVFTYPSKSTQVEHLNARTTRRVAVTLGAAGPTKLANAADSAPRHVEKAGAQPPAPVKKSGEPLGQGTLMLSSKPPCQIVIDGKPTGLTTPQRAIPLSAGDHKVTLVNHEEEIKKTVSVQITANTTEKIIEDLMK